MKIKSHIIPDLIGNPEKKINRTEQRLGKNRSPMRTICELTRTFSKLLFSTSQCDGQTVNKHGRRIIPSHWNKPSFCPTRSGWRKYKTIEIAKKSKARKEHVMNETNRMIEESPHVGDCLEFIVTDRLLNGCFFNTLNYSPKQIVWDILKGNCYQHYGFMRGMLVDYEDQMVALVEKSKYYPNALPDEVKATWGTFVEKLRSYAGSKYYFQWRYGNLNSQRRDLVHIFNLTVWEGIIKNKGEVDGKHFEANQILRLIFREFGHDFSGLEKFPRFPEFVLEKARTKTILYLLEVIEAVQEVARQLKLY